MYAMRILALLIVAPSTLTSVSAKRAFKLADAAQSSPPLQSKAKSSSSDGTALFQKESRYPRAEAYEPDWTTRGGVKLSKQKFTDTEREEKNIDDLLEMWELTSQELFKKIMGRRCINMCAVCLPGRSGKTQANVTSLRTVEVTRERNFGDITKAAMVAPVDMSLGVVRGAVGGVVLAPLAGLVGGALAGTLGGWHAASKNIAGLNSTNTTIGKVKKLTKALLQVLTGSVTAGAVGAVTGALTFALGLLGGLLQGVGLINAVADCGRVSFQASSNGAVDAIQHWNDTKGEYGLKRLWKHTKENGADEEGIKHCEWMRDAMFDVRHASACMEHSELCGGRALIIPELEPGMCTELSDESSLNGDHDDDNLEELRQAWQEIAEEFSGSQECVDLLCTYNGWKSLAKTFHPDRRIGGKTRWPRVFKMYNKKQDKLELTEEEASDIFNKGARCAEKGITLDREEERAEVCQ